MIHFSGQRGILVDKSSIWLENNMNIDVDI